jgi:hypothetical protein
MAQDVIYQFLKNHPNTEYDVKSLLCITGINYFNTSRNIEKLSSLSNIILIKKYRETTKGKKLYKSIKYVEGV